MDRQETWYAENLPLEGEVVVDVGANVGKLSQFFWDQGHRKSKVISVEPMPENVKAIEARIKAAKAGTKWTVKRCAISGKDGHVQMRRLNAQWGLNSMVGTEGDTIAIACRRLEALAPDATVVKVDVEGHVGQRRVARRALHVVVLGVDRRDRPRIAVAQQVAQRHRHEARVRRGAHDDDRTRAKQRVKAPRARHCARGNPDRGRCQTRTAWRDCWTGASSASRKACSRWKSASP